MKKYAIIVAGGTGSRIGGELPKQFLLLGGLPILMHSIKAFHLYDPSLKIIISLHPEFTKTWKSLCDQYNFTIEHNLVAGGDTRYQSVKNALSTLPETGIIAVHDAARPLITVDLIKSTFREAERFFSAIPCIPVNETVRQLTKDTAILVDRTSLRIIQTPQVFDASVLLKAYEQEYQASFTDDASLLEAMGIQPHLTAGDPRNIKITLPTDISIAEALFREK